MNCSESQRSMENMLNIDPVLKIKLINNQMVDFQNNSFHLNEKGILARDLGFEIFFELEELEKRIVDKKFKKKIWLHNIIIYLSICLIVILSVITVEFS